ncbi:MAG: AMP-binding protein, partial [Spirochaetota bacterium]
MFIKDFKRTAIINGDERISYAQLIEHVRDYSTLIDVPKGSRCAIFFENRPEWIYTFFAGWNTGAVNLLIDMMCTQGEVEYILNDSAPEIIFTSDKNAALLESCLSALSYTPKIINVDTLGAITR